MHFLDNPFFILTAKPCDNDARIVKLANERGLLDEDPNRCRDAKSFLMNPRKRIGAEIAWLPVKTREQARKICESLESPEASIGVLESLRQVEDFLGEGKLIPIAKCNVLAAGLPCLSRYTPDEVTTWTLEIARADEGIDIEKVRTVINANREEADLPIASLPNIKEALLKRQVPYYHQAMISAMVKLSATERAEAMTRIVESAIADDNKMPRLITTLAAWYEKDEKVRESLKERDTKICQLVGRLQLAADADCLDLELEQMVNQLIQEVKNWDVIAQPIQLSKSSQGLSHDESETLARRVQDLAEHLFNRCDKLDFCMQLIRALKSAFAEVTKISNHLDVKMRGLNEIAQDCERRARLNIVRQIEEIRASANNQQPDIELGQMVNQLIQSVKDWKTSAQLCKKHYADDYMKKVANLVQKLADDLSNEHGMFDVSGQLREMLQEELAQDDGFVARVDEPPHHGLEAAEDSPAQSALEEIVRHVEELRACADAEDLDSNWDRMLNELTDLIKAWKALAMPIEEHSPDYLTLVHLVVEFAFQLRIAHGKVVFSRHLFEKLREEFTEVRGYATCIDEYSNALEDAERALEGITNHVNQLRVAAVAEIPDMVNQLIQDVKKWKDRAQPIKAYYDANYSMGADHVAKFAFELKDEQCRFGDSLKLFKILHEEFAEVDGLAARVADPLVDLKELESRRQDIKNQVAMLLAIVYDEHFHPDLDRWVNLIIQSVEAWTDLAPPMRVYCGDYSDVANLVLHLAVNLRNKGKRRSSDKLRDKVQDIFGEIPEIETLLPD